LYATDHANHRPKNAGLGAGFGRFIAVAVQAAVTRCVWLIGPYHHNLPIETDRGTAHQWHAMFYTGGVDGKAGGKVITAFHHHVTLRHEFG